MLVFQQMLFRPRHLVIRFVLPLVWRIRPRRKLAALQEFSQTELDSAWQSLYAIDYTQDPYTKAALFSHALEEYYHADLFRNLNQAMSEEYSDLPIITREAVLADGSQKSFLDFLAFFHVGEREVNRDFEIYASTRIDKEIRSLFLQVLEDEATHEKSSSEVLERLAKVTATQAQIALWKSALIRMYRQYKKTMSFLGSIPLTVFLAIIYLAVGWIGKRPALHRLNLSFSDQLEMAKTQKRSYELDFQPEVGGSQ